jgi:hypothetical protein
VWQRVERAGWKAAVAGAALCVLAAAALANAGYYAGSSYSGRYCTSCHQIQASYDRWAQSAHRNLECAECHGGALTADLETHATNLRHVFYQATGRIPDRVVLDDAHVDRVAANCARCHRDTFARWKAGGHSAAYSHIFLSAPQNSKTLLVDDCLRCHGMFAGGNISTVVTPIGTTGPWRLVRPADAERPTMPCLACHSMHAAGTPEASPDYRQPRTISYARAGRTSSLAFYDRRERRHVPAAQLPLPGMHHRGRRVTLSPDRRQAICYQCHSPEASHAVGSGDDRTGTGVHEGIGCLGCHDPHRLDARASCASCHPALSNCGLDVTAMDTSYKSPSSSHNIHFVSCADCHPGGIPMGARRRRVSRGGSNAASGADPAGR